MMLNGLKSMFHMKEKNASSKGSEHSASFSLKNKHIYIIYIFVAANPPSPP